MIGIDKAALPEVEGMKKAEVNKTEEIPKSTWLLLWDLFIMLLLNRSASPDCFTASPIINELIISHTTSSASESYSKSAVAAFMRTMNTKSPTATNPAGIFVAIHSVIADRKANKDTFA